MSNVPVGDSTTMYDNQSRNVRIWEVKELQGIILTLVESLGLRDTQEKATKSILTTNLWDWYHRRVETIEDEEGTLKFVHTGNEIYVARTPKRK